VGCFGWIPAAKCKKTGLDFVKVEEGVFKYSEHKSSEYIPTFWIARFVISVANVAEFLEHDPGWRRGDFFFRHAPEIIEQANNGAGNYPAQFVPIHVAKAYAKWAGFQLPSQRQWEKAARGTDGRLYPWGDEWDPDRCNWGKGMDAANVAPVNAYPSGQSVYGCFNMSGNMVEITSEIVADNENDTHYAG
jgi:formylglycine-generating enzyme required for sulfatase activity